MNQWFITDDSCLQHCRQIPDRTPNYDFVQINSYVGSDSKHPHKVFYQVAHGSVRVLSDYSNEEINAALVSFGYSGMDDFISQNSPGAELVYKEDGSLDLEKSTGCVVYYQLIAEMLFENENQEFVQDQSYSSWNDAVRAVSEITGLDLSKYMDKEYILVADALAGEGKPSKQILTAEDLSAGRSELRSVSSDMPKVPLHDPITAAAHIAAFISNTAPQGAPIYLSAAAKSHLSELMKPIIDAGIGRDRHAYPMIAIKWGFEHMDYVKDLDTIFNKLELLEVHRYRASVTQGEVGVFCNGKEIVRYADDIRLRSNGSHDVFASLTTNEPQYGEIIGGWGSVKPDEQFRRAALTQYAHDIVKALAPAKSLDQMIAAAQGKTSSAEIPDRSSSGLER